MGEPNTTTYTPADIIRLLQTYPKRWLMPAFAIMILATAYAFLHRGDWEVTQALTVRNEALASLEGPGKFRHEDEMAVLQHTLLEIAKSNAVLKASLVEVGPPADYKRPEKWPTAKDVENLQDGVSLAAPKGSEFGSTEVFYLKVKNRSRERALALVNALVQNLEDRFQELRDERARSMIAEIDRTAALAENRLNEATQQLSSLEQEVGTDLAELRILHQSPSDSSELRRKAVELSSQQAQVKLALSELDDMLAMVQRTMQDPQALVAAPSRLLETQPALRRLKDGLVDAQLKTSQLRGTMGKLHPEVRAAVAAERDIVEQIHNELTVAENNLQAEMVLAQSKLELLTKQRGEIEQRLQRLAGLRAQYSNLVAGVEQRTRHVADARQRLADAQARLVSADTASLISRVDAADAGTRPTGPSKSLILLAGMVLGLAAGFGYLLLSISPADLLAEKIDAEVRSPAAAVSNTSVETTAVAQHAPSMVRQSVPTLSLVDVLKKTRR